MILHIIIYNVRNDFSGASKGRVNRTLVSMIKAFLKGQQHEGNHNLGCLAGAYRATPHESTGMTPNMQIFGQEARSPIEVILGIGPSSTGEEVTCYGE